MQQQQILNAKIAKLTTSDLKSIARQMVSDQREGSEIVLSEALKVLMARMDDALFVAFCSEIEVA